MLIKAHERVDDLQSQGLKIIQNPSAFCFGMDAVLLCDFVTLRPREIVADMGTGTGILPVLLSRKQETARFHAFEIQTEMADMAARTMQLNGLENRIFVHSLDMREAAGQIGYESVDAVVCNPPYEKKGGAILSEAQTVQIARHETECSLAEVARACAAVVKNLGRVYLVFPARRMLELCDALRMAKLEPKRMRMVCAKVDRAPYLVLVEAMKNAKPFLRWMSPLVVYHPDGRETEEIKRIYGMSGSDGKTV